MEAIVNIVAQLVVLAIGLAAAAGLAFWAHKAQTDRSAIVGIYLLFGIPGGLLFVAGSALVVNSIAEGWIVLAIGIALLLPLIRSFRKALARVTPHDPKSAIDLMGLGFLLVILVILGAIVSGTDPVEADQSTIELVAGILIQMVAFVSLAYIAVGYRIWRTGPEATGRLGLQMPDLKTIGIGVAFVVPVMISNMIGGILTQIFQPNITDDLDKALDSMTQGILNPFGALLIGLSAGIGEELFFRGALQPRFGIVLTALTFALMHQQYELSWVLLGMFGIGILLGIERQRYGTVAAIITHALMNIIAVTIQILAT